MERYYKITDNGRLVLVGIGEGGEEITKCEYDKIRREILAAVAAEGENDEEIYTENSSEV